jgi:DNA-binding FadR family transcriptional regulator
MSTVLKHLSTRNTLPGTGRRRRLPEITADAVREKIIGYNLVPGDRIPSEWLAPDRLGVSRGTAREALKILEFQGLISTKTGPGGGVFVSSVQSDDAIQMLDNLFLFKAPSISDIYSIRRKLEPELAASLAGRLGEAELDNLKETIRLYEDEPRTAEEEYLQRLAELDFHVKLADYCPNQPLGFICKFLVSMLRDMTVCREIYREANPDLRETGLNYQIRLIRAIKQDRADEARQIMHDHMIEAEKFMLQMAAIRAPGERREAKPGPEEQ